MDWTIQNVIDSKDQRRFKVLLSSRILACRSDYANTVKIRS